MKLVKTYKANEIFLIKEKVGQLFSFQGHRNVSPQTIEDFVVQVLKWNYEVSDIIKGVENLFDREIGFIKLPTIKASIIGVIEAKRLEFEKEKRKQEYKIEDSLSPEQIRELISRVKIKTVKKGI